VNWPGSIIGPQFVSETRVYEDLPRLAVIILMDQNPTRQYAERALDNAHVLIQHEVMDIRAIEQRADRGNQHYVVGPNQFAQFRLSFTGLLVAAPGLSTASRPCRVRRLFLLS
jgi:hypothetical protein